MKVTQSPTRKNKPYQFENHRSQKGFIVLNPVSGKGDPEPVYQLINSNLKAFQYDIYETTGEESIPDIVQAAVQKTLYDWVAAVGGDGTVSLVANGLVASDIPLLIIPSGTSNALSKELNMPQNEADAFQLLTGQQSVKYLDAMQIGRRYYFYQIGVGLESITIEKTTADQKNKLGVLAYLWTGIKELMGWKLSNFLLTVDGTRYRLNASDIILANSGEFGALGLEWGSPIVPDDGRIDIVIVRAKTWRDYVHLLWSLFKGKQHKNDHVQFLSAHHEIELIPSERLPLHGDGEALAADFPIKVSVVPKALKLIVPDTPYVKTKK